MKITHHPSPRVLPRLAAAMWRQGARQIPEPSHHADGQRVLVTGGTGGIGLATVRALHERGSQVVMAVRNGARAQEIVKSLGSERIEWVECDLRDLDSVARCARTLANGFEPFDVLINNAGIWPKRYGKTEQGYEIAFGVNVLGHVLLTESLLRREMLAPGGRGIWVTGDIYVMARECTPDFQYRGLWGGQLAYCRSKLGNLWMRAAFESHYPDAHWYAVHPGVVDSNLAGSHGPQWLRRTLMVSTAEGARATLTCATDADLSPGYLHNTLGQVRLRDDDPGTDLSKAHQLYTVCLGMLSSHLPRVTETRRVQERTAS